MAKQTNDTKQVSEAAFLKALAAKKGQLVKSAKKKRPDGMMSDTAILEKLGIGPKESKTYTGKVNTVKFYFAKQDASRPAFRFVYTLISDDKAANGTNVSKNIILEETEHRTLERNIDDLLFEFQGLGEDTESFKDVMKEVIAAATRHTRDKTPVRITIGHWVGEKTSGMNVKVYPLDDSDLDSEEEEDEEESEDEEEQEFEEVEDEESDDEESDDEEDEEFVPDAWMDGWIDYKFEGDDSVDADTYTLKVVKYNKKSNTFDCVDEDGNEWNTSEGYGIPCDQPELFDWSDKNDE
jgi:hypothetical protein